VEKEKSVWEKKVYGNLKNEVLFYFGFFFPPPPPKKKM